MATFCDILPYALHFARMTGIQQVVWECPAVDTHGRTPLPEWNRKHSYSPHLRVVKVVKP